MSLPAFISLLLISLSASFAHAPEGRKLLTVWNVGQGQWLTYSDNETCLHFDVGGEFHPGRNLRRRCREKKNFVFLSHWDWDHIGLLSRLKNISPFVCIALKPKGRSQVRKEKLLKEFATCSTEDFTPTGTWKIYSPRYADSTNGLSHVIQFGVVLIPGDSPTKQEKHWISQFPFLSKVRILILGHHGSATSTSDELLERLPSLRMSIASARWKRYGHPHPKTLWRLQHHHQRVLRTEDWGHIVIEL